jgi:AraC-like DNA-binding protein
MLSNSPTLSMESRRVMTVTSADQPVMGKAEPYLPTRTQMLAGIREEAARLSRVLRYLNCDAAIRSLDGFTLLTIAEFCAHRDASEEDRAGRRSTAGMIAASPALCTPIYDPQGRLFASLSLTTMETDHSETLTKWIRAVIESGAHAITERFFRMSYRNYWIVAAQPDDAPDRSSLLAVDHQLRVVGADRSARQFLQIKGHPFESRSGLSALFKLDAVPFREDRDTAHRLLGCDDGVPYSVLITPPDRGPLESYHEERVQLHARPRLDMIADRETKASRAGEVTGMAPWLLRRVQQYINTHLDSTLDVEALAASAGLSVSHFTRSFVRTMGTTPHNYVIRRRVERALHLLAETDLDLAEIAITTGFSDQAHFSRRFRQLVGLPPGAFRQRHR